MADQAGSGSGPGALNGLRVLEVGDHVSAPFAGKLLATYGADVIKIETPRGGDSSRRHGPFPDDLPHDERSALFLYLNTAKRSVTLDLDTIQGQRQFRALAARSDVVLENLPPGQMAAWGLGHDRLASLRPGLVTTSVTPFGQTGPYAAYRGPNLVSAAMGGQMHMMGDPDREPLKAGGYQADYQAGLHAFAATAAAVFQAARTGQGEHVDIGAMQCQASVLEGAVPYWCYLGTDTSMRRGNVIASFIGIYPCQDGQLGIHAMASNWLPLVETMEMPELADDPRFTTQADRVRHNDELMAIFYAWAADKQKRAIYAQAGRSRGPIAYVHDMQDLQDSRQLQARGFLRTIDHPEAGRLTYPGPPFALSASATRDERAPLLGEHRAAVLAELDDAAPIDDVERQAKRPSDPSTAVRRLPLEGVRIADLTMVWAGPYATRLLADMGAEVIKIESLDNWDMLRALGGLPPDTARAYNKSSYFNHNNRNKYGATLNLRDERGRALFLELVKQCDVVIENYRAEVMERLGLTYDVLRAVKPDLIMVAMPGHGKTGPEKDYVAYGTNVEQLAGLVSVSGYEGEPPHKSGISYGDPIAGIAAAAAVSVALYQRQRSGQGQYIELAQRECLSSLIGEHIVAYAMNNDLPAPHGNSHSRHAPHDVYPCRPRHDEDDAWVAIACESDGEFRSLCRVIGRESLADDNRFATAEDRRQQKDELTEAISAWTSQQEKYEAMTALQAAGVPAGAVLGVADLTTDPHLRARGFWESVSHADAGEWEIEGPAWRLAGNPAAVRLPAPRFGEHNEYVLQSLLGLSGTAVATLESRGVIGSVPTAGRHE